MKIHLSLLEKSSRFSTVDAQNRFGLADPLTWSDDTDLHEQVKNKYLTPQLCHTREGSECEINLEGIKLQTFSSD